METRYYTERSNARRAAKAAGIDPNAVFETPDGFTFKSREAVLDEQLPQQRQIASHPLDIPQALRLTPEQRREGWEKNPPKAAPARETITMTKKAKKQSKKGATGAEKTETLLKMLAGNGATVEALCKATGWLPHTLRARISTLAKPKKDGGIGLKVERERVDGVTTYRSA